MKKIEQNFYINNKLSFGSHNTELRADVWQYRWDMVISVLSEKYPEYSLILMDKRSHYGYLLTFDIDTLSFKDKFKLRNSLFYGLMERVDAYEFKKILSRFNRYINYFEFSDKELKILFNR